MKIGIISDTHDNQEAVEEAIKFFNSQNVEHVLHAGDMVSPFTVAKFDELDAEFHYVWGNNDGDKEHLRSNLADLGVETVKDFESIEIDDVRFALLHGTDEEIVDALAESSEYDVVVRGHTHEPEKREEAIVINPGPASGYLSDKRTVALFDTEDMKAELIEF